MHQVLEKAEDNAIERESFSSPSFKRRSIRVQITVSETPQEYDFSHSVTSGTMIVSVPPPFQCDVTTCILNGLPSTVTVNVTSVTAGSGGDDAAPLDLKMSVRVMYGPDIRAQEETVDLPLSLAGTVMPSANPALLTPSSGKELYRVRECVSGAVRFAIHSLLVLENRNPLMILPTNQSACLPARPFFFFFPFLVRGLYVCLSVCFLLQITFTTNREIPSLIELFADLQLTVANSDGGNGLDAGGGRGGDITPNMLTFQYSTGTECSILVRAERLS